MNASYEIVKDTATQPLIFFLADSIDHVTGKTGQSPTVTLSKNGGAFASPAGAVSEISRGWYKVAGNATDSNTLGPLVLHATVFAGGADEANEVFRVVANATGFSTVVHVPHTGNNATSGANWKTAVLAAAAGTKVTCDPGIFDVDMTDAAFTFPDKIHVCGSGKTSTIIRVVGTFGGGGRAFTPGSNTIIEDLTLRAPADVDVTTDAILLFTTGTEQVINSVFRNMDIISDNLECVEFASSKACSFEFDNVYMKSHSEWGMTIRGAAHVINARDVTCFVDGNGNNEDFKFFGLFDGSVLIGERLHALTSETASLGQVIRLEGASTAYLTNCSFFAGDIHVEDASGYVLMIGCQYDRTKKTGETSRIADILTCDADSVDSGARSVTIIVDDGDDNLLEGAKIRVTHAASHPLRITDEDGEVEFGLDDFTWRVVITLTGFDFTPVSLEVSGDTTVTYHMTEDVFDGDPGTVTGRLVLLSGGAVAVGVECRAEFYEITTSTGFGLSSSVPVTAISNGSGQVSLPGLVRGVKYKFSAGDEDDDSFVFYIREIPENATDNYDLPSLTGIF